MKELVTGPPSDRWRLAIAERLGDEECPLVVRSLIQTPFGTVRLHRFLRSDDDRALHDHPWSFVTLVLWGSYRDVSEAGVDRLRMGSVRFRRAEWAHRVESDGAVTLVVSGPRRRKWGFWPRGRFMRHEEFHGEFGMPACADTEPRA